MNIIRNYRNIGKTNNLSSWGMGKSQALDGEMISSNVSSKKYIIPDEKINISLKLDKNFNELCYREHIIFNINNKIFTHSIDNINYNLNIEKE